ncbi:MAG: hypothetical protein ACKPKO_36585, partial [Candidatus Fonsibacter sp.]
RRSRQKGNNMPNGPMSGTTTKLMANINESYQNVLAPSQSITEQLMEGQHVDWINVDNNKPTSILNSPKAALSTTNAT